MQLLNSIYDYIDPLASEFLSRTEYLELDESVLSSLLSRKSLKVSELKKFQAMQAWVSHHLANKQAKQQQQQPQQQSKPSKPQRQDSSSKPARTSSVDKTEQPHEQQDQPGPELAEKQILESIATSELSQADRANQELSTSSGEDQPISTTIQTTQSEEQSFSKDIDSQDYRNLLTRLVKAVNIKLDRISNEDIVRYILPTKVFSNDKIFEVMADESRYDD